MEVIYFTHPCAVISANAIPDRLIQPQYVISMCAMRFACNLFCCETMLPIEHPTFAKDYSPLLSIAAWACASIEHIQWLHIYGATLIAQYNKINNASIHFRDGHTLQALTGLFPRNPWCDPAIHFPPDCLRASVAESYRALFLSTNRANAYRRVRPPHWVVERRSYALE